MCEGLGFLNKIIPIDDRRVSSSTKMFMMFPALLLISSISAKYYLVETEGMAKLEKFSS